MIDDLKHALRRIGRMNSALKKEDMLSSGSTLLNLACTGHPEGAFVRGGYYIYVGDSSSGKTWLALSCMAEASHNPNFDEYDIIYDNVEAGARMDIARYFGKKTFERMRPPRVVEGEAVYSRLVEEFYFHVDDRIKIGRPFIYVLDSMDALSTKYAGKKFDEQKAASRDESKEAKGDYGDGKAKINSQYIRAINAGLVDTGSILVVISQTRDNIDAGLFGPKQVYAGGRALKFYANFEIWTAVGGKLWKTVREKDRQVGIKVRVMIKKNRLTGKEWSVEVPLFWVNGIDDIGSCVDWLVEEKIWNKKGRITATGLGPEIKLYRDQLIAKIEREGLEQDLRDLVGTEWIALEAAVADAVERKPRYPA